jgi:hypothetical protein
MLRLCSTDQDHASKLTHVSRPIFSSRDPQAIACEFDIRTLRASLMVLLRYIVVDRVP